MEATEKQIKFATDLGIENAESRSKEELKVLIQEKLDGKGFKDKQAPQQAQSSPNSKDDTIIREVALKCAVEMTEGAVNVEKVLEIADRFVDWIKA